MKVTLKTEAVSDDLELKVCFGRRSMTSLLRGNFWNKQVIQTGSSGYRLHSGEQRARSGTDHTTWLQTPEYVRVYVRECVFRRLGRNVYFFFLNPERRRECAARIKAQLNFSECQKISPESIAPPSFQRLSKAQCLQLEMVGLAAVILRD